MPRSAASLHGRKSPFAGLRQAALALAEPVKGDDFSRRALGFFGFAGGQCPGRGGCRHLGGQFGPGCRWCFKLQAEFDRRVGKCRDRGKRRGQPVHAAAEAQCRRNSASPDLETPELMLQHDRHFFRIFRQQLRRDDDAGGAGRKADVEMMVTAASPSRAALASASRAAPRGRSRPFSRILTAVKER